MANYCHYDMYAVSPNKKPLERLVKIMQYKDDEYYIYRCFKAQADSVEEEDGMCTVRISGYVAWSTVSWFEGEEKPNRRILLEYEKGDRTKPVYGTAHYITLDKLCPKLNIGLEVYAEDPGCAFQNYYHCDHNGEIHTDSAEWFECWEDDDGNMLKEPEYEGGLDGYGEFQDPSNIY